MVSFYKNLFSQDYLVEGVLPCRGQFPDLPLEFVHNLCSIGFDEEIRWVVFGMSPLKALGVDGF